VSQSPTPQSPTTLSLRVRSITAEAEGVLSFDLRAVDGTPLPPFTAGSHVDLHLSNGLIRSYSLLNDQNERHRYVVGVNRDPASRGGSEFMHGVLRPGEILPVSPPRNNFELEETAAATVLIAGGIGVTPMLSMVRRLEELGRDWRIFYSARRRSGAAFLEELTALAGDRADRLVLNFDAENGGQFLDLKAIVAGAGPDAHFYCCGPIPMLKAFEAATESQNPERVHVEYFAGAEEASLEGGYVVELAKSGKSFEIQEGKTILDTLLDAGYDIAFSCMEGVCGSCETAVISGEPDHRDMILSTTEKAANKTMMICCSGSKGAKLVLDL
jgi:ferredoxin-NADP reductase